MKNTALMRIAALFGALICASIAQAQSSPGIYYGQVPTASQWNSWFASKQDVLNFTPIDKAGDVLSGRLQMSASTTTRAGLTLPIGVAPTFPNSGDLWTTNSGMFYYLGGITQQILTNGSPPTFATLTGYVYCNGASPCAAATTIPISAVTGILPAAQLPSPTLSTLGGIKSSTAGVHQFATGVDTTGAVTYGPLACADLSDATATCLTSIGTSGSVIPLLSTANTWGGSQTIPDVLLKGSTSGTITLRAAAVAGLNTIIFPAGTTDFSITGGAGQVVKQTTLGGALTTGSMACADLSDATAACSTALGTSGAVLPLLSTANTWGGKQTAPSFAVSGSTSGSVTLAVPAIAGTNTLTFPAGTTNFSATGGTSQVVKQTTSGGALTVARLACADLSDAGTGCSGAAGGGGSSTDLMLWGAGSDGNATISSGTTTLTRDMFYNNLTVSGTGKIVTAGWRIFVAGTLDISAAPASAINYNGNANSTGTPGAALASNSVGGSGAGGALNTIGGAGNNGGAGGAGATGGAGGAATVVMVNRVTVDLIKYISGAPSLILGGAGGGGASTSNAGSSGGGAVVIFANIINRGASTAAAAIQAKGGTGTGASSGGGGGGGGWIYIVFKSRTGTSSTNALDASGGNAAAGTEGTGGTGGRITLVDTTAGTITETSGGAPTATVGGVQQANL